MPEEVIRAIMARRNPRTGSNYTRDEAEAIYYARISRHPKYSKQQLHELTKGKEAPF